MHLAFDATSTILATTALLAAAAGCAPLPAPPVLHGHLDIQAASAARRPAPGPTGSPLQTAAPSSDPTPVSHAAAHPPSASEAAVGNTSTTPSAHRGYSIDVRDIPAEQLLLAIGRDAGLELDLHSGIGGRISMQAHDRPLPELLERIARQADVRYELRGRHLTVRPDTPEIRSYMVDYVNLSRDMRGTVATSTQIATSGSGGPANRGGAANAAGNASVTQIETRSANDFWNALETNLAAILAGHGQAPECSTKGNDGGKGCRTPDLMINRESGIVMVRASARQHEQLAAFLGSVQRAARRQVMIEATIVEVTLADGYRQGVDWTRLGVPSWSVRPRGSGDATAGQPTLSYLSTNTDIRIELLETFGTVKVLSSPRLSVLNNQTAMLKVVEEVVYFLVDSTTTEYDDRKQARISATTTPQSVSVGMVMSVTPQISADGDITLNVRPTISGISGFKDDPNPSLGDVPNRVPQIRTREIESMLRLRSGEVAVLGGLMEDRIDHDTGRIPLLGDLPVVGEIFTRRDNGVRRTELLIFLRPLLIDEPGMQAGYAGYAAHLPDNDFLLAAPSPGQRNFPHAPLRPLLVPGSAAAAPSVSDQAYTQP
ncbi:secretin N-terminal domain-containing protein [Thauera sp.]|jgi:general secretion pathway protein D|uniref:type II secretion system protein GspD n=1 Tax=Thauera sp. TaxID=1905334 RepID=UPI002610E3B6|nr:secretin N-terminal domain-containing protein [Thauera sp.]